MTPPSLKFEVLTFNEVLATFAFLLGNKYDVGYDVRIAPDMFEVKGDSLYHGDRKITSLDHPSTREWFAEHT